MTKNRTFVKLAYNGNAYSGWQIQPNAMTVQGKLQEVLSTLYQSSITLTGCGRTDSGVHASMFFAHVDLPDKFSLPDLHFKLNGILPADIVILDIRSIHDEAHTRFDADARSYVYKMVFQKDPFRHGQVYLFDQATKPDFELTQKAAGALLEYGEFFTFCKTHSENDTYKCDLRRSEWQAVSEGEWHYHVTADRFLRGMVRMIVGMCLNVGMGRMQLEEVRLALDNQERLARAWSVPASGLFLSEISYPYL